MVNFGKTEASSLLNISLAFAAIGRRTAKSNIKLH